jgi:hypothetical protein
MQTLLCNANIQFFQFEAIDAEGAVSFKNLFSISAYPLYTLFQHPLLDLHGFRDENYTNYMAGIPSFLNHLIILPMQIPLFFHQQNLYLGYKEHDLVF